MHFHNKIWMGSEYIDLKLNDFPEPVQVNFAALFRVENVFLRNICPAPLSIRERGGGVSTAPGALHEGFTGTTQSEGVLISRRSIFTVTSWGIQSMLRETTFG